MGHIEARSRIFMKGFCAMDTARKWSLQWSAFLLLVSCIISVQGLQLGPFIGQQELDRCKSDLLASDDGDGMITAEEYTQFISLHSDGQIDETMFYLLPARIIMVYYYIACSCSVRMGAASGCCVGSNAHIEIDEEGAAQPEGLALEFCSSVESAIFDVLNPTQSPSNAPLTAAPSASPTVLPTLVHSAIPSAVVTSTDPPSVQPTITATDSPSSSPSGATESPSAGVTSIPSVIPSVAIATDVPSYSPTSSPTGTPTFATDVPTEMPSTTMPEPSMNPTTTPTAAPTSSVSESPSLTQTSTPTASPTATPSSFPTERVTGAPSAAPSLSATEVPTLSPSVTSSEIPTAPPSIATTEMPTASPSVSATSDPTASPSVAVTENPTTSPSAATENPTASPSVAATETPTASPSVAATETPTASPSVAATETPTASPSVAVTDFPTSSPSVVTTEIPTISPSVAATETPTASPSAAATVNPTVSPTVSVTEQPSPAPTEGGTLCITFLYGLTNEQNLSASDLFNEVNNTLKTGLEIATRTVTIRILNETFPRTTLRSPHSAGKFGKPDPFKYIEPPKVDGNRRRLMSYVEDAMLDATEYLVNVHEFSSINMRQQLHTFKYQAVSHRLIYGRLSLPNRGRNLHIRGSRRLVFYTDEIPVVIERIVDNPICPPVTELTRCAVVDSTVCVVLEGEDPLVVRTALIRGLRESIASGEFEDAIPPEHKL